MVGAGLGCGGFQNWGTGNALVLFPGPSSSLVSPSVSPLLQAGNIQCVLQQEGLELDKEGLLEVGVLWRREFLSRNLRARSECNKGP